MSVESVDLRDREERGCRPVRRTEGRGAEDGVGEGVGTWQLGGCMKGRCVWWPRLPRIRMRTPIAHRHTLLRLESEPQPHYESDSAGQAVTFVITSQSLILELERSEQLRSMPAAFVLDAQPLLRLIELIPAHAQPACSTLRGNTQLGRVQQLVALDCSLVKHTTSYDRHAQRRRPN